MKEILNHLENHEEQATKIARAKTLALDERIDYIQENGVNIYGAVVTGPASEIRKLQDNEYVRSLKVGRGETMELAMKIKSKVAGIPGLVSIISALLGLAYFNVEYLTKMNTSISPYVFFIMASVFSGIVGLFSKKSRLYAIWGLGIGIFLVVHLILMIFFSININYKP